MTKINHLSLKEERKESLPSHYYVREITDLGLTRSQIYYLIENGLLRTAKKGKFFLINKNDVDNLVDKLENSYSALEASKKLGITSQNVRLKIRQGKLRAFKIGNVYRVSKNTLDDFMKKP